MMNFEPQINGHVKQFWVASVINFIKVNVMGRQKYLSTMPVYS